MFDAPPEQKKTMAADIARPKQAKDGGPQGKSCQCSGACPKFVESFSGKRSPKEPGARKGAAPSSAKVGCDTLVDVLLYYPYCAEEFCKKPEVRKTKKQGK